MADVIQVAKDLDLAVGGADIPAVSDDLGFCPVINDGQVIWLPLDHPLPRPPDLAHLYQPGLVLDAEMVPAAIIVDICPSLRVELKFLIFRFLVVALEGDYSGIGSNRTGVCPYRVTRSTQGVVPAQRGGEALASGNEERHESDTEE